MVWVACCGCRRSLVRLLQSVSRSLSGQWCVCVYVCVCVLCRSSTVAVGKGWWRKRNDPKPTTVGLRDMDIFPISSVGRSLSCFLFVLRVVARPLGDSSARQDLDTDNDALDSFLAPLSLAVVHQQTHYTLYTHTCWTMNYGRHHYPMHIPATNCGIVMDAYTVVVIETRHESATGTKPTKQIPSLWILPAGFEKSINILSWRRKTNAPRTPRPFFENSNQQTQNHQPFRLVSHTHTHTQLSLLPTAITPPVALSLFASSLCSNRHSSTTTKHQYQPQ